MIDVVAASLLIVAIVVAACTYAAHVSKRGAVHFARVDQDGGSPLLGRGAMEMGYWAFAPVGHALARAGFRASTVSWTSLGIGLLAALAAGTRHFGVAALLLGMSAIGDMLDGMVARDTGTVSDAGALLDVAVDRYVESAFLIGVAIAFRASPLLMIIALAAMVGGWFVTFTSAKAEAMGADAPRGSMRRPERAVYLIAGAALTPLTGTTLPLIAAAFLVAAAANASAVTRFIAIARSSRAHRAERITLTYGSPSRRAGSADGPAPMRQAAGKQA